jgi:hypothetical protein
MKLNYFVAGAASGAFGASVVAGAVSAAAGVVSVVAAGVAGAATGATGAGITPVSITDLVVFEARKVKERQVPAKITAVQRVSLAASVVAPVAPRREFELLAPPPKPPMPPPLESCTKTSTIKTKATQM